jgi:hypothetical protein
MVATNQIKKLRESNLLLGDQAFSLPFELFRNIAKTLRSSAPVLSVSFLEPVLQNPGFPRVFRISRQFIWSSGAPMLARCMADRGVAFRVAHPKSSRFSRRVGVCQKTFFH